VHVVDVVDLVTQDLEIDLLRDEQGHVRLLHGFRRELADTPTAVA
jgi:hypothetical protein